MGDVVLSVDAELAWGYHDLPDAPDRVDDARDGWHAALDLFDRYDVPATWAIVGHLFLESCDGRHADHALGPDWFSCDAGAATPVDDWRAPDLVDEVRGRPAGHEVGSHSFSHVLLGDGDATRATADAELRAAVAAALQHDVALESFVFPRNWVGHRDVLAEHGFRCYRGIQPDQWYDRGPAASVRPLAKLADWTVLGRAPPIVRPTVDEYGLVNLPASLYLFSFQGRARELAARAGRDPLVAVAKRGVDRATRGDGVFHAWLHPHNLLQPGGRERLDAILRYVDRRRADGLRVRPMGAVAADVLDE